VYGPVRRLIARVLLVLLALVVVLNWTYGRLPASPRPTGSFVQLRGGLRVRYLERPGSGPAVLLIHGLPGTAEDWNEVTPLLAGRRTIAIDRPGYGFSSGGYFPLSHQLQAVQELIERLHLGHPILVGHSYGGAISLAFAERHPGEVDGLVLVDAAATCTRNSAYETLDRGLTRIETPAVVIQGASDHLVKPACGRRLAALLPKARLEVVSGGHMVPYTHPQTVAAAVQSLVANYPGG
jgi:pimeloyl-ACP methyl ester carboxylesterase